MSEEEALAFARDSLGSIWTLEVLVIMARDAGGSWTEAALEREVRGSKQIVRDAVRVLSRLGLVSSADGDAWRYAPGSAEMVARMNELISLYASKPMTVVKAILSSPNQRVQTIADAFRLKD